jgi:hypothetical protein
MALSIGTILCSIGFLRVSLPNDLFYRRIGHEALAARSLGLSLPLLALYRSFQETANFLILLHWLAIYQSSPRLRIVRGALWCSLASLLVVYGLFVLVNNRYQTALFLLFNFVGFSFFRPLKQNAQPITARTLGFFGLITLVCMQLVVQFRMQIDCQEKFDLFALRPIAPHCQAIPHQDEEQTPARWRLNGLDLMARITRPALDQGFLWGKAWVTPVSLYYYALVDRDAYQRIKLETRTNPKTYLLKHYLGDQSPDYFSSLLTDLYGNFAIWLFPLPGLLLGWLAAGLGRVLARPSLSGGSLALLYMLTISLYLEKESLGLLANLIKFSAIPIIAAGILGVLPRRRILKRGEQ